MIRMLPGAVVLFTLFALFTLCLPAAGQSNVLILVADDVGVDAVGCYAEGVFPARTPTIDKLAASGVLFRNAWAAPICSATRAQILTGRYGYRTGMGHVANEDFALDLNELTLPEVLDLSPQLGIAHAAFGKWHLGNSQVGGLLSPNLAGWAHFAGTMANLVEPEDYSHWTRVENGSATLVDDYPTTRIVDDFLAWHAGVLKPWVAYVAFHAAHQPFHEPPAHLHSVDLTNLDPRHHPVPFFRAMVEALDTELGRLLAGLGDDLDRTHILFVGDNGTVRVASVPPFEPSHAKMTPYEGGLNVPLIIAGPGVQAPGREVSALVAMPDLFDTALELAGIDLGSLDGAPERDGASLTPHLRQLPWAAPASRQILYQEYFGPSGPGPYQLDLRIARDGRYKLIRNRLKAVDELYDLDLDPFETTNLLPGPLPLELRNRYGRLSKHIEDRLAGG